MKCYITGIEAAHAAKVLLDKAEETGDIALSIVAAALEKASVIQVYGRANDE